MRLTVEMADGHARHLDATLQMLLGTNFYLSSFRNTAYLALTDGISESVSQFRNVS
jgi:hypothetical protein